MIERLAADGRLGAKSGQGFYDYPPSVSPRGAGGGTRCSYNSGSCGTVQARRMSRAKEQSENNFPISLLGLAHEFLGEEYARWRATREGFLASSRAEWFGGKARSAIRSGSPPSEGPQRGLQREEFGRESRG